MDQTGTICRSGTGQQLGYAGAVDFRAASESLCRRGQAWDLRAEDRWALPAPTITIVCKKSRRSIVSTVRDPGWRVVRTLPRVSNPFRDLWVQRTGHHCLRQLEGRCVVPLVWPTHRPIPLPSSPLATVGVERLCRPGAASSAGEPPRGGMVRRARRGVPFASLGRGGCWALATEGGGGGKTAGKMAAAAARALHTRCANTPAAPIHSLRATHAPLYNRPPPRRAHPEVRASIGPGQRPPLPRPATGGSSTSTRLPTLPSPSLCVFFGRPASYHRHETHTPRTPWPAGPSSWQVWWPAGLSASPTRHFRRFRPQRRPPFPPGLPGWSAFGSSTPQLACGPAAPSATEMCSPLASSRTVVARWPWTLPLCRRRGGGTRSCLSPLQRWPTPSTSPRTLPASTKAGSSEVCGCHWAPSRCRRTWNTWATRMGGGRRRRHRWRPSG